MIILYPYHLGDESLAAKNADWIMSLKNDTPLRVILVHDERCTLPNKFGSQMIASLKVKDRLNKWPQSPNTMFSEGARFMEYNFPNERAFLWLEPDAIPLRDHWLDDIIAERNRGKKAFTGAYVPGAPGQDHLSGVAVYPNPLVLCAGGMLMVDNEPVPFDIADSQNVVRQSHFTDLIQNRPRKAVRQGEEWIRITGENDRFHSLEDFYKVATKECVLFHYDKHGDLIDLLRSRHGSANESDGRLPDSSTEAEPKPATQIIPKEPFPTRSGKSIEEIFHTTKQGDDETFPACIKWLKDFASISTGNKIRVGMALTRAGLRPKRK